jgi:hypothetical protein
VRVSLRHAFLCLWPDPDYQSGGDPPPALSQGPVIPLLALRSFALPVENDGRPPPRAEPRATRGHRRVPRGWQGSCSRLVSTGCVGFCRHGARGEVACISNPRGGCPGLRKDLLLGLFFGGMRLVTWDVSTFAYVPVDKGRVYRCVENTRWVHGSMPRLNDSWRLINRHSQRWSAQLHPNMGVGTLHHSPAASSSSGYSGPGVNY